MINKNGIYFWKFVPEKKQQDAYENLIGLISSFSPTGEEPSDEIVEKIFKLIRSNNTFPIIYYNQEGIDEEIQSLINKNNVCFVDDSLYTKSNNGKLLLDFLFPNLHLAESLYLSGDNNYNRFYNDDKLKFCIKKYLKNRRIFNMRTMYFSISRYYWSTPINFSPIRAKAIYEKFCPPNGTIYDYSAGFGGRMLGALSSKSNFTYIGTDPNKNTYYNLKQLGQHIERNTKRTNSYQIFNSCSENFSLKPNSIDFAFSCPPFFKRERYCSEETQSVEKFPNYEDWLEGYVRPTIKNCYSALKDNGIFGFDIVDYYHAGKKIPLIADWTRIAEEEGFYFRKSYPILSSFRNISDKESEQIYIFTKTPSLELIDFSSASKANRLAELEAAHQKTQRRKKITYAEYDIFGNLLETYNKEEFNNIDFVNNKKPIDTKYYRVYRGDESILSKIDVKLPLCQINNSYYFKYAAVGKALGISRQAVAQAFNRKATKICNKDVIWYW